MSIWEALSPYELTALILVGVAQSAPIHVAGFIHQGLKKALLGLKGIYQTWKQPFQNNLIWIGPTLCGLVILAFYLVYVDGVEWSKSESWKDLASYFSGMATPIVTFVAVLIAFKQLKQAEKKHADEQRRHYNEIKQSEEDRKKEHQKEIEKTEELIKNKKVERIIKAFNQDIDYISEQCNRTIDKIANANKILEKRSNINISHVYIEIKKIEVKSEALARSRYSYKHSVENDLEISELLTTTREISSLCLKTIKHREYLTGIKENIKKSAKIKEIEKEFLIKRINLIGQNIIETNKNSILPISKIISETKTSALSNNSYRIFSEIRGNIKKFKESQ